ncbi:MAG: imidazole glycerol phosphate synthase subunit HisH [Chloroflexota bacterium]
MIAIVDHGMGNLGSVENMLRRIGADGRRTADPDEIKRADRLVLAGIGAFDGAAARLREIGLMDVLNELVLERRVPVLGVCLGMQLMARTSEEGSHAGLGWLDAEVRRFVFRDGPTLRLPHMGWESIQPVRPSPLFDADDQDLRFYFSHGYHLVCHDPTDVAAVSTYGYEFAAAVHRGNIVGTQFHPEKSHHFGMDVYRRFLRLPGSA